MFKSKNKSYDKTNFEYPGFCLNVQVGTSHLSVGRSIFLYCLFSINCPSEAFPSFFTGSSSSSSPFLLLFSQLHFHALYISVRHTLMPLSFFGSSLPPPIRPLLDSWGGVRGRSSQSCMKDNQTEGFRRNLHLTDWVPCVISGPVCACAWVGGVPFVAH